MKQKKVPLRMCTGCGEMKPKRELVRVVKDPEDNIGVDFTGKKPGRGAYICRSTECLEKARKGRRLERAFQGAVPEEVYHSLKKELEEMNGE